MTACFAARTQLRLSRLFVRLFLLILICHSVSEFIVGAEQLPTIDRLIEAWRTRKSATAVHYQWVEKVFQPKSAFPVLDSDSANDQSYELKRRLAFQGDSIRYDDGGTKWSRKSEKREPYQLTFAWNGMTDANYLHLGNRKNGIRSVQKSVLTTDLEIRPVLLAFRPLAVLESELDSMDFLPNHPSLKGQECVVLTRRPELRRQGVSWPAYWLDIANEFRVLRFLETRDSQEIIRLDIEYEEGEPNDYNMSAPSTWRLVTSNDDGSLRFSSTATAVRREVNKPIDPLLFQYKFPVGTTVVDQVEQIKYIVLAGGGRKIIPYGSSPLTMEAAQTQTFLRLIIVLMPVVVIVSWFAVKGFQRRRKMFD